MPNQMLYKDINLDGTLKIESYMYTPSLGKPFLALYTDFRKGIIETLLGYDQETKRQIDEQFFGTIKYLEPYLSLKSSRNFLNQILRPRHNSIERFLEECLNREWFTQTKETKPECAGQVNTGELIRQLIFSTTSNTKQSNDQLTNLLIHKFEVSKKFYNLYVITNNYNEISISKGTNTNASDQTYWLFSLLLLINSVGTDCVRVLSTLLKINDLLCSIPIVQIVKLVNAKHFAITLAIEALLVNDITTRISATHEAR